MEAEANVHRLQDAVVTGGELRSEVAQRRDKLHRDLQAQTSLREEALAQQHELQTQLTVKAAL